MVSGSFASIVSNETDFDGVLGEDVKKTEKDTNLSFAKKMDTTSIIV